MAGTIAGGQKAAATNKERYGDDWYARIGSMGGANGHDGGFASKKLDSNGLTGPERAKLAGYIGGKKSKRGPAKKG